MKGGPTMAETINVTSINENPLCSRLQKKFAGRGAASAGTKAVKNAYNTVANSGIAKAANPFEETGEFVRAGGTVRTASAYQTAAKARTASAKATSNTNAYNSSAFEKTATFERAYARAAGVRAAAADINAATRQMPRVNSTKSTAAKAKTNTKAAKAPAKTWAERWQAAKAFFCGEAMEERKIKSTPISKGLILSAIVIVFIVALMLFSIAQINEFKNEISNLQADKARLLTTVDDLNVLLDAKNDIRFIEEEATGRIGMVRSNQVATEYISISDGERIEVVDATSEETENEFGVFGTLMSVVGTNWDHLMEYIN